MGSYVHFVTYLSVDWGGGEVKLEGELYYMSDVWGVGCLSALRGK